jgi:hypothetical protein
MADYQIERYLDKHAILPGKAAPKLTGPYKFAREKVAPNRIVVEDNGGRSELVLRGCQPTDDDATNRKAILSVGMMCDQDIFLLVDSVERLPDGNIKGIVYTPTTQYYTGTDPTSGEMRFYNANYIMQQMYLLLYGEVWLDRMDTEYEQYPVFLEAERLARKYRRGYWATHDTAEK